MTPEVPFWLTVTFSLGVGFVLGGAAMSLLLGRPKPRQCAALATGMAKGRRCKLEADHEGPHCCKDPYNGLELFHWDQAGPLGYSLKTRKKTDWGAN